MIRKLFEHLPLIKNRLAESSHILLGLDYDGTLTPLVDDPSEAKLAPVTREVLRALAGRPGISVAIVSGRALDDLRAMVSLDGLIYAGNHGLDICGPGLRFVDANAVAQHGALRDLALTLASRLQSIPGAFVEDKALTISVHFRRVAAHDWDKVRRVVGETLAKDRRCFRMTQGHKVFEIFPCVDWNKGKATRWIQDQLGRDTRVLYLGDDETDEDAFHAFPEEVTVKVGDPADTSAHFHVETPAQVHEFLHWLFLNWLQVSKKGV